MAPEAPAVLGAPEVLYDLTCKHVHHPVHHHPPLHLSNF